MKKRERVTRPALERQKPLRTWSTLFGGSGAATKAAAAARLFARPDLAAAPDAVQKSVGLGYQVIEEYIKQGQAFAGLLSGPSGGGTAARDLPAFTEQMFKFASEFASSWMKAVGTMGVASFLGENYPIGNRGGFPDPRGPDQTVSGARVNGPQPAQAAIEGPVSVSVEVESKRRAKTRLDLRPEAGRSQTLTLHALRSKIGRSLIKTVSVERDDGSDRRLTISVRVPDNQPPGTYSGLLIDSDSSLPVGTLTLDLSE